MPVPTRSPLGASTTARKWYLDVDTNFSTVSPNWIGVFGITDFQPKSDPTMQDDSDYDSEGYGSETKTAEKWSLVMKVARKVTVADATVYDPGQEYLRSRAIGKMGPNNSVHVRWYEMTPNGPRAEAYDGIASVTWSPDGGKMSDLDIVSVTLGGQGKQNPITHPNTGAVIPVITLLTPAGGAAAGGNLVRIAGTNFTGTTGATGVKIGGTNATAYDVISDGLIEAIAPAHAAGQVDVIVTNAAGASAATAQSKYTYS
ncbi:phage tail tube protein [Amycolatopsis kentuckyensis]|uniref:phage tail tube protein n=1 Tax=Amycolatopsis kentuckyensis TaxID=218823 RepID=UPI000A3D26C8|nr:IPT/TIG domain-containing protein [Amycolatopsis kentuckyensis]